MTLKNLATFIFVLLVVVACNSSKSSDQSDLQAVTPGKKILTPPDGIDPVAIDQIEITECRSQTQNIFLSYEYNSGKPSHVAIFRGGDGSESTLEVDDDVSVVINANFVTLTALSTGQFKVSISRPLNHSADFLGTLQFLNSLDIEIGLDCKIQNDSIIPGPGQASDADLISCTNTAQTQTIMIKKLPDIEVLCPEDSTCSFAIVKQREISVANRRPPGDDDSVISGAIVTDTARETVDNATVTLTGPSLAATLSRAESTDGTFSGTYSVGQSSKAMKCSAVYNVLEAGNE